MSATLRTIIFVSALLVATGARAALTEGLLVEAELTQGTKVIAGRVLVEAGRTEWTTIAESSAKSSKSQLKLEARATLLEADVVEVETRVSGGQEQTGKLIVRLGEKAMITTSQMESAEPVGSGPRSALAQTSVGVKVFRVRYSF